MIFLRWQLSIVLCMRVSTTAETIDSCMDRYLEVRRQICFSWGRDIRGHRTAIQPGPKRPERTMPIHPVEHGAPVSRHAQDEEQSPRM